MDNEIWIDAYGFPNHEVSSHGHIRNKKTKHVLKPNLDRYGYPRLSIGSVDNVPVHRVVCESFYGPKPFKNAQVNHIDYNRTNNYANNLEWCTPSENIKWSIKNGNIDPMIGLEKAKEVNLKKVYLVETGQIFNSVRECAYFLGVPSTNVSRCLTGVRKGQRIHGYHVMYLESEGQ